MKTVLVASDGSAGAERAVAFAAALAHGVSADIVIVTASPSPNDEGLREFSRAEGATLGEVVESIARTHLARARTIAGKADARVARTEIRDGDPAEIIMAAGREFAADAIVVGKRGQGRLAGLLLGSVSQKLVTLADRPVVVVP